MQARAAKQTARKTDKLMMCASVCMCVYANAIQRKWGKGRKQGLGEVSQLQLLFCNNVLNLCQAAPKKTSNSK